MDFYSIAYKTMRKRKPNLFNHLFDSLTYLDTTLFSLFSNRKKGEP